MMTKKLYFDIEVALDRYMSQTICQRLSKRFQSLNIMNK